MSKLWPVKRLLVSGQLGFCYKHVDFEKRIIIIITVKDLWFKNRFFEPLWYLLQVSWIAVGNVIMEYKVLNWLLIPLFIIELQNYIFQTNFLVLSSNIM